MPDGQISRILIIERNDHTRALLQCRLPTQLKIKFAPSMEAASEKLRKRRYDLIVWNACSDSAGGIDLTSSLDFLSGKAPGAKAIVFTAREMAHGSLPCEGQIAFKKHPSSEEEFLSVIESSLPVTSYGAPTRGAHDEAGVRIEFEGMITVGLAMRPVIRRIIDAAAVDIPVLITGETGTGKDLIAAAIHRQSARKTRPYVAVNMGAMAPALIASEIFGHERGAFTGAQDSRPGMFEQAHGGTVFLDEIATMDEKTQVSLLRVLKEKTVRRVGGAKNMSVDVRVIAASNEDLEKRVALKAFRTVADSLTAIEHARREPLDTAVLVSTGSLVNVADTVFNLRDLNRSMEIIILVNRLGPRSGRFLRTLLDHPIERTRVLTRRQLQRELTASCARQYRRTPR